MVAETLKVKVEAETQDAENKLGRVSGKSEQASTSSNKLAGAMGKAKVAIAAAGVAAAAAGAAYAAHLVRQGLAAADEQAKLARQLGVTNEQLAVMQRAAELSGMSAQELGSNMERLNRRLGEAAAGSGQAADALDRIGISAEELEQMAPDEQMEVLGEALAGVESHAQKASIASDLFGRSGQRMMVMLEDAESTLNRARNEVDQFGLALDSTDTDIIEGINDDFSTMGAAVEGASMQLAVAFSPALEVAADLVTDMAGVIGSWSQRMSMATRRTNELAEAQQILRDAEEGREAEIEDIQEAISAAAAEEIRLSRMAANAHSDANAELADQPGIMGSIGDAAEGLGDHYQEAAQRASEDLEELNNLLREIEGRGQQDGDGDDGGDEGPTEREIANRRLEESIRQINELQEAGLITELNALQEARSARMQFIQDYQDMGIAIGELANVDAIQRLDEQIEELTSNSSEAVGSVYELGSAFSDSAINIDAVNNTWQKLQQIQKRQDEQNEQTRERFASMTQGNIASIREQEQAFVDAGVSQVDAARWAATQIAQEYMSMAQQVGGAAMGLASTIIQSQNQATQNKIGNMKAELDELDERHDTEIELMKKAGATDAEIENMKREQQQKREEAQQKADEKEKQLKMQQFRREQAMSVAQSVMNTAQAVTKALTAGPVIGPILAGTIGALGAAEIGVITSQQPPAFERGGSFVTDGPQTIQVGDGQSPRERVTVEPLTGPYSGGGSGGITVNISGVVGGQEVVAEWVDKGIRRAKERGRIK